VTHKTLRRAHYCASSVRHHEWRGASGPEGSCAVNGQTGGAGVTHRPGGEPPLLSTLFPDSQPPLGALSDALQRAEAGDRSGQDPPNQEDHDAADRYGYRGAKELSVLEGHRKAPKANQEQAAIPLRDCPEATRDTARPLARLCCRRHYVYPE
jgi:hypothetical protein